MEDEEAGFRTAYVNEGYLVGTEFVLRADSFSDPTGYPRLSVVPDDEYYTRRGIGIEDVIEVPASLDAFFERFNSADPKTREKLLRASYWLDAAYRVWDISKSLSYVAAINAVEVLAPDREPPDPCPCCHQDRNPGPTAQFRTTVETYAAAEGAVARARMYNLRSTLVHGRGLHSLDVPRTWGALEPATEEHRSLHDVALAVARTAIRTWFLERDDPPVAIGTD